VTDNSRTFTFKIRSGVSFHDGSPLTAEDVKVSYDRIRNPPKGVVSVRKAQFSDIASVEAPDPLTLVIKSKQPNASLLTLLASPWNCIYSAKLLASNPDYPARVVMGSGPFRFVQHIAGSKWTGKKFENYFRKGLPYLDGFEAYNVSSSALVNALAGDRVMAEFRGISAAERDRLKEMMGARIKFEEGARLTTFQIAFNTTRKPFDDARVRRALSMAIDRFALASQFRVTTLKGGASGLVRPDTFWARTPEQLAHLPGMSQDIAAARAEARRLLKEAGQENLKLTLTNEALANPYAPLGVYVIDQWRQIGVTATHEPLEAARWNAARFSGNFDAVTDFVAEFVDEPSLQLAHYISHDKAPDNISRAIDRTLDELYEQQLRATDPAERKKLVSAFEDRVLTEAYVAPISWGWRITALAVKVNGWVQVPSHFINQDLAEVWLDK